jgi:hypothetical protein
MIRHSQTRSSGIVVIAAFALALTLLSGCTERLPDPPEPVAPTAMAGLAAARSALPTAVPDAKLLVVQTAEPAEPTATPVWAYLFGSPSTDKTWVVYIEEGQATTAAEEFGTANLSASEWAKVPGTEAWKVDSDEAYKKALSASGAKGDPAAYMMGFITYKPRADTSTLDAFVWSVRSDPGTSGATTKTVTVNAKTGAASLSK